MCVCVRVCVHGCECASERVRSMDAQYNKHVQTNLREPPGGSVMVVFSCVLATFERRGNVNFLPPVLSLSTHI